MSVIDTLITDRTQADADRVRYLASRLYDDLSPADKAEWDAGMRGAYTQADFERVQSAEVYIAARLQAIGCSIPELVPIVLEEDDRPSDEQMAAYLAGVADIRAALAQRASTPEAPDSMRGLTLAGANAIERILVDTDSLIDNIPAAWVYAAEVYGGEV